MLFNQGHALLIGVSTHQSYPQLDVPIAMKDAKALADTLLREDLCGYPNSQVNLIHSEFATKISILSALDELATRVCVDDTVLFFYCGHGALGTDGKYYLVSSDVQIQNGKVLQGTGVSEEELLEKFRMIDAKRVLIIFNACHSGNMSPTLKIEDQSLEICNLPNESTMYLLSTGQGRLIITACRQDQVSYIGQGSLTIFTQALVDGLNGIGVHNNSGFISAFSLYEHIHDTVKTKVNAQFGARQEAELTVLKGVGSFAVSLYKGTTSLGSFDTREVPPEQATVKHNEMPHRQPQIMKTEGSMDKITTTQSGGVSFGSIRGDNRGNIIAGHDIHNATLQQPVEAKDEDVFTQKPALHTLRDLFSNLYSSTTDTKKITQDVGIEVQHIDFGAQPATFWHTIMVEAHLQNKIKVLVGTASFEHRTQTEELQLAYDNYINS